MPSWKSAFCFIYGQKVRFHWACLYTGWVRKNGHPGYKYLISLFFCRFFEIFSKQPTKWYKCKTLVSWISDLYHSLTSKAAKMSINTAISEKVIKLYKGHLFAIKISFLSFKRVVNSYFIKEIHIEQILTAKDWYFNLR